MKCNANDLEYVGKEWKIRFCISLTRFEEYTYCTSTVVYKPPMETMSKLRLPTPLNLTKISVLNPIKLNIGKS